MSAITITLALTSTLALGFFSWKKPRLSSIIIWTMVASVLLTSAALIVIPGEFRAKAVWLSMVVPIIWVAFQYWCYWADSQWKVLGSLITISLASIAIIFSVDLVI